MDDGDVLAVYGGGVLGAQLGYHLLHHIHSKLAALVQGSAGGDLGLGAVSGYLGAVGNVGAGLDHIAHHGVQCQARLAAQELGSFYHGVVHGGQLQHIGLGDIVAILGNGGSDGGNAQVVAAGGNALGKGGDGLGQGGELAELDGLAGAGRDGALLAKLVMHQGCLGLVDEGQVVKGLHLGRQRCGGVQIFHSFLLSRLGFVALREDMAG